MACIYIPEPKWSVKCPSPGIFNATMPVRDGRQRQKFRTLLVNSLSCAAGKKPSSKVLNMVKGWDQQQNVVLWFLLAWPLPIDTLICTHTCRHMHSHVDMCTRTHAERKHFLNHKHSLCILKIENVWPEMKLESFGLLHWKWQSINFFLETTQPVRIWCCFKKLMRHFSDGIRLCLDSYHPEASIKFL